jgi:hypothetical protein
VVVAATLAGWTTVASQLTGGVRCRERWWRSQREPSITVGPGICTACAEHDKNGDAVMTSPFDWFDSGSDALRPNAGELRKLHRIEERETGVPLHPDARSVLRLETADALDGEATRRG